jgi:Tfp pilus assembly protein PilV
MPIPSTLRTIFSERGATLLEVLAAAVLLSLATIALSLTMPKMSAAIANNRRRWIASNFASAYMQELKSQPYPTIQPNPQTDFKGVGSPGSAKCDCNLADLSSFPTDPNGTVNDSGVTFTRKVCVGLVDRVGSTVSDPMCPDTPLSSTVDRGLKNIRVRVMWASGANTYFTDIEGLVTR